MIIVGLGNPGKKYEDTRHNAGHMLIDFLKQNNSTFAKVSAGKQPSTANHQLIKTDCFMNTSGAFIKKLLATNRQLKTENLYIAHDDLDLPLGKFKISFARGPKVHNGILSIEEALGTDDFWRIRIGIDNRINPIESDADRQTSDPKTANRKLKTIISGEQYVLSPFSEKERSLLHETFGTIAGAISNL